MPAALAPAAADTAAAAAAARSDVPFAGGGEFSGSETWANLPFATSGSAATSAGSSGTAAAAGTGGDKHATTVWPPEDGSLLSRFLASYQH